MKNILFIMLISVGILRCTDKKTTTSSTVASQAKTEVKSKSLGLSGLTQKEFERLFNEASYVDYIFYNLPFSISQNDQASVRSNLQLISNNPLSSLPEGCKPIGREFFQIAGEVAYEADVYFSNGCYGYVFLKDEKPIYANQMSEEGIKFYGNLIKQAQQLKNGNSGQ